MIRKELRIKSYLVDKLSAKQISNNLGCSENKVNYWLQKYSICKRNVSEAVYLRLNPEGDPFVFKKPVAGQEWFLYGLGLGLFWGEGNKVNKHSVRLGNTDPALIKAFLEFLYNIYQIDKTKLRFGIQLFSDTSPKEALDFWQHYLNVSTNKFHKKVIVTESKRKGTYGRKSPYGVLTVYFSNFKLRDNIISAIEELRDSIKPS